jgi:predicted nuclease with TOPRIM domain
MIDLTTRIADVKKKAEAAKAARAARLKNPNCSDWLEQLNYYQAATPDLFLAMAERIEELQAKADDWQTMKDELDMARFGYQAIKEDTDNEIAGLRERIEELEKEALRWPYRPLIVREDEENHRLYQRNEELEKALEPFAEAEARRAAKGVWLKKRGTITTQDTLEDVIDDTIVLGRETLRTAARALKGEADS